MTKLYIAGPMTGIPEYNFPAFMRAAEVLRQNSYEVVNPAELDMQNPEMAKVLAKATAPWGCPEGMTLKDFMKRDLPALLECDGIVLLPGWATSAGVKIERAVAGGVGMAEYSMHGPKIGSSYPYKSYLLTEFDGTRIIREIPLGYVRPTGSVRTYDSRGGVSVPNA